MVKLNVTGGSSSFSRRIIRLSKVGSEWREGAFRIGGNWPFASWITIRLERRDLDDEEEKPGDEGFFSIGGDLTFLAWRRWEIEVTWSSFKSFPGRIPSEKMTCLGSPVRGFEGRRKTLTGWIFDEQEAEDWAVDPVTKDDDAVPVNWWGGGALGVGRPSAPSGCCCCPTW